MSATQTVKLSAAIKSALAQKVLTLVAAEKVATDAAVKLGFVKVEMGYPLADALAALNGGSVVTRNVPQTVKDRLLTFVTRKDLPQYTWDTVAAWIDAATVERTLADDQRGKLNSDALRTVKRYGGDTPSAEQVAERQAFVKARLAKGETTVKAVRAAYKLANPGNGTSEPDPLKVAARIKASDKVDWKGPQSVLNRNEMAVSLVMPFIMLGIAIGQAFPNAGMPAITSAINTTLTDGKSRKRTPKAS